MYRVGKRFLDIVVSFLLLVLLFPLFLLIMLAIAADSEGNAVFIQKRAGLYNKPFSMLKFRTMFSDTPADVATHALRDADSRITPVGRFLRRTSLDELPQLWNILKGDMSFVGPRPVVLTETDLLELRTQNKACTVRPGLTGWAQVNGRDNVPVQEKAKMDAYYARQVSFATDCRILLKTVGYVLESKGIHEGANPAISEPGDTSAERSA